MNYTEYMNDIREGHLISLEGMTGKQYENLLNMAVAEGLEVETDYPVECEVLSDDDVIILQTIVSPYNTQKTIAAYIAEQDMDYEHARMELTVTTQYHDWGNTLADSIHNDVKDAINEGFDVELDNEQIELYNNLVSQYNKYGDREYLNVDDETHTLLEKINR